MSVPIARPLCFVFLAFVASVTGPWSPHARAQGARIVSAAGQQDFATLTAAVAAAADGDVILVGAGTYAGFSITGKGLTIAAAPQAATQGGVVIQGSVTVSALPAQSAVLLQGLTVGGGMLVLGCQGLVRAQDCSIWGYGGAPGWDSDCKGGAGGIALQFTNSQWLSLTQVSLTGGEGGYVIGGGCLSAPQGGAGGQGLWISSGSVSLYDCTLSGGDGGQVSVQTGCGGAGAAAVQLQGGSLFASGSSITGGAGAWGPNCGQSSGGGGVVVAASAVLTILDSTALSGPGGASTPAPISGPGTSVTWPKPSRGMDTPTLVVASSPYSAVFTGLAGDEIHLLSSGKMDQKLAPWLFGVLHLGLPVHLPLAPLATIPVGASSAAALVPGVRLMPGAPVGIRATQAPFRASSGVVLGPHRFVVALSPDVGPDCNGNGVSDYVDVLFGAVPDANHNLIPDTCPGG